MPEFVILKHIAGSTHYDVMFEKDGALKTFTLRSEPDGPDEYEAEQRFDHLVKFLDFEGDLPPLPIQARSGRAACSGRAPGRVERWDRGVYEALEWGENLVELNCRGEKWNGRVTLKRKTPEKWLLKKHPQEKQ